MHDLSEMDQSYYDTLSKSVVRRPEINYCSDEEADCISGDDHGKKLVVFKFFKEFYIEILKFCDLIMQKFTFPILFMNWSK